MLGHRQSMVYRSRDKEDWMCARGLLEEQGIAHKPSEKEEMPMGGCGAKIQPGNFWGKSRGRIFCIEVALELKEKAERILQGKVLPVRECGIQL